MTKPSTAEQVDRAIARLLADGRTIDRLEVVVAEIERADGCRVPPHAIRQDPQAHAHFLKHRTRKLPLRKRWARYFQPDDRDMGMALLRRPKLDLVRLVLSLTAEIRHLRLMLAAATEEPQPRPPDPGPVDLEDEIARCHQMLQVGRTHAIRYGLEPDHAARP
ncbi:MAG: hypothetical protein HQL39_17705 [Alphaproteobacteria bacterium]|nr:hypothetical protein [Alphaproteobacteria bacterium]